MATVYVAPGVYCVTAVPVELYTFTATIVVGVLASWQPLPAQLAIPPVLPVRFIPPS